MDRTKKELDQSPSTAVCHPCTPAEFHAQPSPFVLQQLPSDASVRGQRIPTLHWESTALNITARCSPFSKQALGWVSSGAAPSSSITPADGFSSVCFWEDPQASFLLLPPTLPLNYSQLDSFILGEHSSSPPKQPGYV